MIPEYLTDRLPFLLTSHHCSTGPRVAGSKLDDLYAHKAFHAYWFLNALPRACPRHSSMPPIKIFRVQVSCCALPASATPCICPWLRSPYSRLHVSCLALGNPALVTVSLTDLFHILFNQLCTVATTASCLLAYQMDWNDAHGVLAAAIMGCQLVCRDGEGCESYLCL